MSENTARLAGYLDKQQPGLYQALSDYAGKVTAEADRTGIPRRTLELLNYRASQINGCAFLPGSPSPPRHRLWGD
ncbi:carboxymuconolactone decarboxylase family protein [Arthrobacter sp. efr-133-TYG-120]|uniref:carboxymuconolactone decarboxylase family protein n=1 Tax=Arthrobacter sp. efr-133-TYG-120 TaxID=3040280 RepID=UPI00254B7944|nr:carboxymuconolactone decarboxylase family protein [Arthrobacter sp. efr-133-TYG-120]